MESRKLPDWTANWKAFPYRTALFMKLYTWTRIKSYYTLFPKTSPFGKSCLEIGAGTGYISKLLAKRYQIDTTLIDNNEEAYRMFQKTSKEGEYLIVDAFSFKPEEKFDIVFSDGLIEHFHRKERMGLIRVHRNLTKSDGSVIIFVPKKSWLVENLFDWKGVLEIKYDYHQLEAELMGAGLHPIARAEDWHMIGVLSTV